MEDLIMLVIPVKISCGEIRSILKDGSNRIKVSTPLDHLILVPKKIIPKVSIGDRVILNGELDYYEDGCVGVNNYTFLKILSDSSIIYQIPE